MGIICINILQNLLNTKLMFDTLLSNQSMIQEIYRLLETSNKDLIDTAGLTLAALCSFSHQTILGALSQKELNAGTHRFSLIINAFTHAIDRGQVSRNLSLKSDICLSHLY